MSSPRLHYVHPHGTNVRRMRPPAAPRPRVADFSLPGVGDVCLGASVQRSTGAEIGRDPAP